MEVKLNQIEQLFHGTTVSISERKRSRLVRI